MSQILTISPTLVHDLWIAGATATVTAAVCFYVQRFKRFAVDEDKAIIKAVVGGDEAWHAAHRQRFERAYASLGGGKPKAVAAEIDESSVNPEPLALSDRSHADEQADHTDTDRAGMWRVLLGLASDLVDRVHDWLPNLLRQWRERNQLGSGQPSDNEPWVLYDEDELREQGMSELELKMLRDGCVAVPYDEATDAEARWLEVEAYRKANPPSNRQPEPQPVQIVRVNRYRDPGLTGQFPYVKVAGAPRHAAPEPEFPAINVPLQREGGDE